MPESEAPTEFLGVHHVMIVVPPDQKEAAKRFYEQVIGFVPLENPLESSPSGNLWWYACGRSEFHVALLAEHTAHPRPHAAFHVANLPALRARLRRHGIEPRLDFSYKGHWRVYVTDPWNNRTEYISQLPPGISPGMAAEEIDAVLAGR
jgi:catechol 2,3-dioxygenase-like lactoylglutathione lyase family enzyme